MLVSNWFPLTRHVRTKLSWNNLFLSESEIVHLGALAIVLERHIQCTQDTHRELFQPAYIEDLESAVDLQWTHHPMFSCAVKRLWFRQRELELMPNSKQPVVVVPADCIPDPCGFYGANNTVVVDDDDCFECNRLDEQIQLLRLSRIRRTIYEECYQETPRQTLLHTIAIMYVYLRNASYNSVDMYLFLQVTFAMTRLHSSCHAILLSKQTKNRYFALWTMFFIHYYTDSILTAETCQHCVAFDSLAQIRTLSVMIGNLVCVRRHNVNTRDLFLARDVDQWTMFVDELNRMPEIVKLRTHWNHAPFVFNLDVKTFVRREAETGNSQHPRECTKDIVQ